MSELFKMYLSVSVAGTIIAGFLFLFRPITKNKFSKTWHYYAWLVVIVRLVLPFSPFDGILGSLAGGSSYTYETAATTSEVIEMVEVASEPAAEFSDEHEWASDYAGNQAYYGDAEYLEDMEYSDSAEYQEQAEASEAVTEIAEVYADGPYIYSGSGNYFSEERGVLGIISILWAIVFLVLFVRKFTAYRSFIKFIKSGCFEIKSEHVLAVYNEALEELKIKKPIPIYLNKLASSPMLVGIFKQFIILPEASLQQRDLKNIFLHELGHYKRADSLYKWAAQLAMCLHWFNPAVYFVFKEIEKDCELSCDENIIKNMTDDEIKSYGDTLVDSLNHGGNYGDLIGSLTLTENGKHVKDRLKSIINYSEENNFIKAISYLSVFMLFIAVVVFGSYKALASVNFGSLFYNETAYETDSYSYEELIDEPADEKAIEGSNIYDNYTESRVEYHDSSSENEFFHEKFLPYKGYLYDIVITNKEFSLFYGETYSKECGIGESESRDYSLSFWGEAYFGGYKDLENICELIEKIKEDSWSKNGEFSVVVNNVHPISDESDIFGLALDSVYEKNEKNEEKYKSLAELLSPEYLKELILITYEENDFQKFKFLVDLNNVKANENNLSAKNEEEFFDGISDDLYFSGRSDFFEAIKKYMSKEKLAEFETTEKAASENSAETERIDNYNLAKDALLNGDITEFASAVKNLPDYEMYYLAEEAYEQDEIVFFSLVMNRLNSEQKESFKNLAGLENKEDFFALLDN